MTFETYSPVNITHGLKNYFDHPEFKVLLCGVARLSEGGTEALVLDFVRNPEAKNILRDLLDNVYVAAHNAIFELMVLHKLGIHMDSTGFLDSAVLASIAGAGRSLEASAPQLLNVDKLASGKAGIQLFSIPGTYQMEQGHDAFDPQVIEDHPDEWMKFAEYCGMDAALSLELVKQGLPVISPGELTYASITTDMNLQGWHVDVPLVREMQRRYEENTSNLVQEFREACEAPDLNLFSSKQLGEWCEERGIRASSFDEQHVAKLKDKVVKKIAALEPGDKRILPYRQVVHLLDTKQALGGSSLKKLKVILDQVHDGRLYDQYLHAGAGQTLRTTGRGVQMQNLHRLGGKGDDVTELFDPAVHWDNAKMARNLRQVFTATDPDGFLVVGDYSAVESRGLAWLAGEEWKLDTYRQGTDVYKMQAAKFFGVPFEQATAEMRTFGKVGELSCGYQAGAGAVKSFAEKMGVVLSDGEAAKLVQDFRRTNARTVALWKALQDGLEEAYEIGLSHIGIPHGTIRMSTADTLDSLLEQEKGRRLKSLLVKVDVPGKDDVFTFYRYFHGLYRDGGSFNYFKPSERKTGDLWSDEFTDPKTGRRRKYSLYGGKLAGVLTQSLCRQIFMEGMANTYMAFLSTSNVRLIGQFHDELVLDWQPPETVLDQSLDETTSRLEKIMSSTTLPEFPLACEVKWDYRYTK